MSKQELIAFCKRWLEKADKYSSRTKEDVFDKFTSLYVAYNAIYFEVTLDMIQDKRIGGKCTGDRVSATKNIPVYIGQDILAEKLSGMTDEINTIISLIKNGIFYISTKKDNFTPDHEKDNQLINNITIYLQERKKKDQQKFNESVLSLIYGARCNMFHGKKEFLDQQIELLTPMNNILRVIIEDLLLDMNREDTHE